MRPETCTRRIQFCCGHRVHRHEGKCANLHGHNYVLFVTAQGSLDSVGRVIDFSVLKERIGGWIDQNWDHGFVLGVEDQHARICVEGMGGQKLHLTPLQPNSRTNG